MGRRTHNLVGDIVVPQEVTDDIGIEVGLDDDTEDALITPSRRIIQSVSHPGVCFRLKKYVLTQTLCASTFFGTTGAPEYKIGFNRLRSISWHSVSDAMSKLGQPVVVGRTCAVAFEG